METYTYKGISDGKYVEGDIEALNLDEASHKLKEQNIIITNLVRASKKKKEAKEIRKQIEAEETAKAEQETIYKLQKFLKKGECKDKNNNPFQGKKYMLLVEHLRYLIVYSLHSYLVNICIRLPLRDDCVNILIIFIC